MNILTISGAVIFLVWAYIMFARPLVLARFPVIVTIESKLWAGSRQVLMARVMSLGGVVVAFHDLVLSSGADASSLLGELAKFVPDPYRPLALSGVMFVGGLMLEWMRKETKGEVGSSLPAKS
jgi:hypothetical protein